MANTSAIFVCPIPAIHPRLDNIIGATSGSFSVPLPAINIALEGGGTNGNFNVPILLPKPNFWGERTNGNFSIPIPLPRLAISTNRTHGSFGIPVVLPSLIFTGRIGTVGSFSVPLPKVGLALSGHQNTSGSFSVPLPQIGINLRTLASHKVLCVSTDLWVPWEYEQFAYSSITEFQGKVVVANSTGIFILDSEKDNGSNIDASFTTGLDNAGDSSRKIVPKIIVGLKKGSGDIEATLIMDEEESDPLGLPVIAGDMRRLTNGPKGLIGTYMGLKIVNVEGVGFDIDNIQFEPQAGERAR